MRPRPRPRSWIEQNEELNSVVSEKFAVLKKRSEPNVHAIERKPSSTSKVGRIFHRIVPNSDRAFSPETIYRNNARKKSFVQRILTTNRKRMVCCIVFTTNYIQIQSIRLDMWIIGLRLKAMYLRLNK